MRTLLLPILLWAAPCFQENAAETLVRGLSHDEFSEREKADQRLRNLGESARPTLEKAILTADPEIRTRCQDILAVIDAALPQRRALPDGWTVTVPNGEHSLGELAGLLKKQIPVDLEVPPELADSRVRIGAQNIGFFKFLDRLTETHGGITFSSKGAGSFRLIKGTPSRAPVCYPGPMRVSIDRLTLESWERFGTTWRGASMVLAVTWQPDVAPIPAESLPYTLAHEVSEVEIYDQNGKEIRGIAAHYDAGFAYSRDRMQPTGWRVRVRIPDPPLTVKRLSRIRGKINLIFPTRIEVLEFKKPLAEVMESSDIGVFTVRYSNCRRTESGVIATVAFSRPSVVRPRGERDDRLILAARYAEGFMRMVGPDGTEYPLNFMLGSGDATHQREIRRFSGYFDIPGDVASLKVPLVVNYYTSLIEFEFLDVELP